MKAAHRVINEVSDQAQTNLNNAAKIGIKPLHTKYPKAKVGTLADKLAGLEPEAISAEVQNLISHIF